MAGVNGGKIPPKDDTLPETPAAKASDPRISIPGDWQPPSRRRESGQGTELARGTLDRDVEPSSGARMNVAFGGAHVRTFEVRGPMAFIVALVVLAAVGVILSLTFVFAVGVGVALTAGAAVVAVLGAGVASVRHRLNGAPRARLDAGRREP